MLDALKAMWQPAESLVRLHDVISAIMDILDHFEQAKLKDGNTRDAAIDTVIQLLQSQKTKQ